MFEGMMAPSAKSTPLTAGTNVVEHITGQLNELRGWRRDIHAHPEIAFEEHRTARLVAEKLRSFGIDTTEGIATTGVVGTLSNGSGPSIGLRADLDALPMDEQNSFEHRSTNAGCFHGCGHDGHTVMLLAAARFLAESKRFRGTVNFIFQPAEESAGGGRVMVDEGLFERFPCEQVYALHNWPSLPKGYIAVRSGAVMASTDRWDLTVVGKGGHAAFPHQTVDPILVGSQIVSAWQALVARELSPTTPAVVSTTKFHAGSAYNVIPERAVLSGTVRALSEDVRALLKRRLADTWAACWSSSWKRPRRRIDGSHHLHRRLSDHLVDHAVRRAAAGQPHLQEMGIEPAARRRPLSARRSIRTSGAAFTTTWVSALVMGGLLLVIHFGWLDLPNSACHLLIVGMAGPKPWAGGSYWPAFAQSVGELRQLARPDASGS